MSRARLLSDRYTEACRRMGLSIQTMREGLLVVTLDPDQPRVGVCVDGDEPNYLRLMLAFMRPDHALNERAAQQIANRVNSRCCGAVVSLPSRSSFTVETQGIVAPAGCLPTLEHLLQVLPRHLSILAHARSVLADELELAGIWAVSC